MQLTTDRSEIGAVLINGKLYVAGGNALGRQDSPLFQEIDLATGRWRDLAPMPKGSSHLVMATLNGKIYLAGGFTANVHRNPLDQFIEYDPATNQWRSARAALRSARRGRIGGGRRHDPCDRRTRARHQCRRHARGLQPRHQQLGAESAASDRPRSSRHRRHRRRRSTSSADARARPSIVSRSTTSTIPPPTNGVRPRP